jgi:hypothetical protein
MLAGKIRCLACTPKSLTITDMRKNSESVWASGLAINLTSNLIAVIVGGTVTYFSHQGSTWVKPLLFGGMAWLVTFISILAVRFMRRMPPRVELVTPDNIGSKIRNWLDEFSITVQNLNNPDFYFLFIVTINGKKISIFRSNKMFTDYIEFSSLVTLSEEEKREISNWSEDKKNATKLAVQLELSRAIMGYKFDDMFDTLSIFRRIPITPTLTAEEIFKEIWAVEAMLGSIAAVIAMGFPAHQINKIIEGGNGSAKKLPHSG